jgi:hypothetical protein
MSHQSPEWEQHTTAFGSKQLRKYGWTDGNPVGKSNNALILPLFQHKNFFDNKPVIYLRRVNTEKDRKRLTLSNELFDLMLDDNNVNIRKQQNPLTYQRLEYFRLGSFDGPLLREIDSKIYELKI